MLYLAMVQPSTACPSLQTRRTRGKAWTAKRLRGGWFSLIESPQYLVVVLWKASFHCIAKLALGQGGKGMASASDLPGPLVPEAARETETGGKPCSDPTPFPFQHVFCCWGMQDAGQDGPMAWLRTWQFLCEHLGAKMDSNLENTWDTTKPPQTQRRPDLMLVACFAAS